MLLILYCRCDPVEVCPVCCKNDSYQCCIVVICPGCQCFIVSVIFFSILFVQSTSLVAMFYWFCFLMSILYCNFDLVLVFPVLANVLVAMLYFGCLLRLSMLYCRCGFFFQFFSSSPLYWFQCCICFVCRCQCCIVIFILWKFFLFVANRLVVMLYCGCLLRLSMLYCRFDFFQFFSSCPLHSLQCWQ